MRIIAPVPYKIQQAAEKKNPQTGKTVIGSNGKPVMETKEIKMVAYKVVSVFDVSQTEGKELPTIPAKELTGEVRQYKDFFAALENASPVPILFEEIGGNARGYYHLEKKLIVIDKGMPTQSCMTFLQMRRWKSSCAYQTDARERYRLRA